MNSGKPKHHIYQRFVEFYFCFSEKAISCRFPLQHEAQPMPDPSPPSRAARRAASRERRLAKASHCEDLFDLVVSGFSHAQIAYRLGVSVKRVRRDVDKAVAARAGEAPGRFVSLQRARLEKALRVVDCALEDGDMKAVAPFINLVAELDRYHGLAARVAPPLAAVAALPAPAAPPLALTHLADSVPRKGA
jgi:hypothetical protein